MTLNEARSAMLAAFKARWDADTPAVNGGAVPLVEYDGVGTAGVQPHDSAWARVTVRHTAASQGSLASAAGARVWDRLGIIVVQVFTPLSAGRGLLLADALATVAKNAFEGVDASGVWFRNVRVNEIGSSGPWYQTNVTADFEYYERR